MTKSVLFISHFFPPVGGAGVQRATKFVKYLPEYGWAPTVLTVQNPSVPIIDESLLLEIPPSVEILRAKTLEPGYQAKQSISASNSDASNEPFLKSTVKKVLRSIANFLLQPDPQILWWPAAKKHAEQLLKTQKFDAIIATAPPFSSLMLGASLAKKFDVPLLLDYRDEWDISNAVWENKNLGPVSTAIQIRMQNFAIKNARAIVATTKLSADAIQKKANSVGANLNVECIYNGYDGEDFERTQSDMGKKSTRYLLSYVGTLWNLTSVSPLVNALLKLSTEHPELSKSIEFVVAGRKTAEQKALLDKLNTTQITLTEHDYLEHEAAVELMRNSDGLCILLSDMDVAKRVIPAKTFEYFAAQNSILCIAPDGEVWKLLEGYPRSYCSEPDNIDLITDHLVKELRRFIEEGSRKVEGFNSEAFERKSLTSQLANLLEQMSA